MTADDPLSRERRPTSANGDLTGALRGHLAPGEGLLWCGRPDPKYDTAGFYVGCAGMAVGLAGLVVVLLLLLAVAAEQSARSRTVLLVITLAPLSLLVLGAVLIIVTRRHQALTRRSIHGITDRRLLSLTRTRRGDDIVSIDTTNIGPVRLHLADHQRGTIMIQTHTTQSSDNGIRITQSYDWFGVPDAQKAHRLIAELQAKALAAREVA